MLPMGGCGLQRMGQLNTNVPIHGSIRIQIQTVLQIQIQSIVQFELLGKSKYSATLVLGYFVRAPQNPNDQVFQAIINQRSGHSGGKAGVVKIVLGLFRSQSRAVSFTSKNFNFHFENSDRRQKLFANIRRQKDVTIYQFSINKHYQF